MLTKREDCQLEAFKTEVEAEIAAVRADSHSQDSLVAELAVTRLLLRYSEELLGLAKAARAMLEEYVEIAKSITVDLSAARQEADTAQKLHAKLMQCLPKVFEAGQETIKREASNRAQAAANALHGRPGSSRDKQEQIRAAWASGKYANRDMCAEQECAALNMAFGTARKALRNTPEPPRRCGA
jgi:hypothetical protein